MQKKAVCIMSGGMDSTLGAYMMKERGYEIIAVHFNYDQRTERKEREAFHAIADAIGAGNRYDLDIGFFKELGASALTDKSIDVPTGGLEEGVPVTYVPFRNGIFLSMAAAIAEKEGAEVICIGVVEEDSSGYPERLSGLQRSLHREHAAEHQPRDQREHQYHHRNASGTPEKVRDRQRSDQTPCSA